jgi:hypothetical protein
MIGADIQVFSSSFFVVDCWSNKDREAIIVLLITILAKCLNDNKPWENDVASSQQA